MKHTIILNRDGGTIKNMDVDSFCDQVRTQFEAAGHDVSLKTISGKKLIETLESVAADPECDVMVIAGGDGSLSAAAAYAWEAGKALAILPAGTMNLFARSIGMSLDIEEAVREIADGKIHEVDLVTANGRPFLHQYSAGIQPEIVQRRDRQTHTSRLGKIIAGIFTYLETLSRPPRLRAEIHIDGAIDKKTISFVCVTNNLYGKGHIPHADMPDKGQIGIYTAPALSMERYVKLTSDLFLGSWDTNPDMRERSAKSVKLIIKNKRRKKKATLDGELIPLEEEIEFEMHHRSLKVIIPRKAAES